MIGFPLFPRYEWGSSINSDGIGKHEEFHFLLNALKKIYLDRSNECLSFRQICGLVRKIPLNKFSKKDLLTKSADN